MTEPEPDYEPADPERRLPASRPPRDPSPGALLGRAQGVSVRVESAGMTDSVPRGMTVLAFRLVPDGGGPTREVELRGASLSGTVQEGDWVEVADRPGRSGRLEVVRVANLSTGSEVSVAGSPHSGGMKVFRIVFAIVFVLILIVIVAVGIAIATGFLSDL